MHILDRISTKAFWASAFGLVLVVGPAVDAFLQGSIDAKTAVMMALGLVLHSGGQLQQDPVKAKPPGSLLSLLVLFMWMGTGCAGMASHKGPLTETCASLKSGQRLWTTLSAAAVVAGGAGGLAALPVQTTEGRDAVLLSSVAAAAFAGVSHVLADHDLQMYGELCETSTVARK